MDLFDLVATLSLDTSEYERKLDDSEAKGGRFGGGLASAGKVAVAAVGAASAAVGALTKSSVEAYANYEQLAGGVKKLYGDAADEVMKYAEQGYKTSGMSANKYMELATSFSASLINSLNGDQQAAAAQTDVAMRSISDNVNTFGSDMASVQNAYAGFAKGQFNMLDNLKLGYGGTKAEMERLIADANEYAEANGMAADLSVESFSDIVTAIDLVQQKQGIAGTTAKEAATTIEGSFNMTKAAWENLVAGLANPDADMGQLMDNLIVAIVGDKEGEGLLNQLIPALERAVEGIGQFLEQAIPLLADKLPSLIETFLPVIIQAAVTLVSSIIKSLPKIITTLVKMMPKLIKMVIDGIVEAITSSVPTLINEAPQLVMAIATGLLQTIGTLISAGAQLISSLGTAIWNGLSSAAQTAASYAQQIPARIKSGLGSLYSAGVDLIQGLWNGIKAKWDALVSWFSNAVGSLKEKAKSILQINSPSKVFMEIGKSIPEGLALGIERNMDTIDDATEAMTDATAFTPSSSAFSANGGTRGDVFNFYLNYDADTDATDMVKDIARGVQRYRMAGAI